MRQCNLLRCYERESRVEFNPQIVACGASLVRLMYESMSNDHNWEAVRKALVIEKLFELGQYEGREKGILS